MHLSPPLIPNTYLKIIELQLLIPVRKKVRNHIEEEESDAEDQGSDVDDEGSEAEVERKEVVDEGSEAANQVSEASETEDEKNKAEKKPELKYTGNFYIVYFY